MALSPLVQAVEHFSLAQLMADPNLCRNVLNDMGAQPSEVFLLVAALEARIPQTLLEHTATNDLSVVEPRLVSELNQRGVERSRAEWAVNAWKEVVGGSSLAQETVVGPSAPAAPPTGPVGFGSSEPATVRPSPPAPERPREPATARPSEPATVRSTAPAPAPPVPPAVAYSAPATPPPAVPSARERRGQKGIIIVAAAIIVVLVAAVVALLATRSNGKHDAATSSSSGASNTPSTPASSSSSAPPTSSSAAPSSSTAAANLAAPLGAAKIVSVPGTAAWTDTGLMVTAGERINVTATGQVSHAPGQFLGPDGIPGFDVDSTFAGHHAGLMGVIGGSGAPFFVGASFNGIAPAAGELWLGINDMNLADNGGKFAASVRLQAP